MPYKITEKIAEQFKQKALQEGAIAFIWFNNHMEIIFKLDNVDAIRTPQWVHISAIKKIDDHYLMKLIIWDEPDIRLLYDTDTALKYPYFDTKVSDDREFTSTIDFYNYWKDKE